MKLFQRAKAARDSREPSINGNVLWTDGYHSVEPVLIYNRDGFKPQSFRDLASASVAYVQSTGLEEPIAAVRAAHPEVKWTPVDPPSADALIAQVSEGTIDYAIVASSDAAAMRNVYLDFDVAFTVGPRRELAWVVAPGYPELRTAIDQYFARLRKDGTLARYTDRYFGAGDIVIEGPVKRRHFERWIAPELAAISGAVDEALARADLAPEAVDRVFLTGGSSFVPAVRQLFAERFGGSKLESGDELVSIASGLALIAAEDDLDAWTMTA